MKRRKEPMMLLGKLLPFLLLFLNLSCQVKGEQDEDDIVSGNRVVTNAFTVEEIEDGILTSADNLDITLTFPIDVVVLGTPRIALTIGATTRYANYLSGDGTKTLIFRYTIVGADDDTDGIAIVGLELNGGTLQFNNAGTYTDCDITTVEATDYEDVIVDNTAATVSSLLLTNAIGFYRLGSQINFTVIFSEIVYVTGTPQIAVTFESGATVASYVSGSGTTMLQFRYTITNSTYNYTPSYTIAGGGLSLNSGTILDGAEIAATLALPALGGIPSATVDFDGRVPYVISVTPPEDGSYSAAQNLDVELEFDRAVTVTGTPYIVLTIGSTPVNAVYTSGSGTTNLIFRYTTIPGDVDTDGLGIAITVTQNAGDITGTAAPTSSYFNSGGLNNTYSVPSTVDVIIDSPQPQVTSVSINADTTSPVDNYFKIGDSIYILVGFNDEVFVDQTSGTPRLVMTLDSGTVYANYYSGGDGQTTLVFRYVVLAGDDEETGGITFDTNIDLNGGSITNDADTNAILTLSTLNFPTRLIDGIRPTVSSVTPPSNDTYSTVSGKDNASFTFVWNEAVAVANTVYMPLTVGVTSVNGTYVSGTGTANIIMRYTPTAGHTDTDGIALTGTLTFSGGSYTDLHGNAATVFTYTPPVTTSIFVDTTAPTILSVTAVPANDTYLLGENLDFTLQFSETVYVNSSGGYPRLRINLTSGGPVYATYLSGDASTSIIFRYTVAASKSDLDGITMVTPLQVSGAAYIRDIGWNNTGLGYTIAATTNVYIDSLGPTVSTVTRPTNGTYDTGDTVSFTVNYDEAVNITGVPQISVTTDTGAVTFDYASGSGTTALVFSHTIAGNTLDLSGIALASTTIGLNGGTMADANTNNANRSIAVTGSLTQVRFTYDGMVLWGDVSDTNNRSVTGSVVNSLTDKSGNGNTLTTTGSPIYSGNYLTFDGINDQIATAGSLSNIQHVIVVARTPQSIGNFDFLSLTGLQVINLTDDTTAMDLDHAGEFVSFRETSGAYGASVTTQDVNWPIDTYKILMFNYAGTPSGIVNFGNSTYNGRIGEMIIFDNSGALTGTQLDNIRSYLSTKYSLP